MFGEKNGSFVTDKVQHLVDQGEVIQASNRIFTDTCINKKKLLRVEFQRIYFYTNKIQLSKKVINDVFSNFTSNTKMLVFGLGYDSKMWYNGNRNTYFIENKDAYIKLNENDIPKDNIIKYEYKNINVKKSLKMSDNDIREYNVPEKINQLGPFDIIIIDGPKGWSGEKPGRLIPYYWTTHLSKKGTIIYGDDSSRPLESYCINKFFKDKEKFIFKERLGCTKIIY